MLNFSNSVSGSFYSIEVATKLAATDSKREVAADESEQFDEKLQHEEFQSFALRLPDRMGGRPRRRSVSDARG